MVRDKREPVGHSVAGGEQDPRGGPEILRTASPPPGADTVGRTQAVPEEDGAGRRCAGRTREQCNGRGEPHHDRRTHSTIRGPPGREAPTGADREIAKALRRDEENMFEYLKRERECGAPKSACHMSNRGRERVVRFEFFNCRGLAGNGKEAIGQDHSCAGL